MTPPTHTLGGRGYTIVVFLFIYPPAFCRENMVPSLPPWSMAEKASLADHLIGWELQKLVCIASF